MKTKYAVVFLDIEGKPAEIWSAKKLLKHQKKNPDFGAEHQVYLIRQSLPEVKPPYAGEDYWILSFNVQLNVDLSCDNVEDVRAEIQNYLVEKYGRFVEEVTYVDKWKDEEL